jgi:hypothetical protein
MSRGDFGTSERTGERGQVMFGAWFARIHQFRVERINGRQSEGGLVNPNWTRRPSGWSLVWVGGTRPETPETGGVAPLVGSNDTRGPYYVVSYRPCIRITGVILVF